MAITIGSMVALILIALAAEILAGSTTSADPGQPGMGQQLEAALRP